MPRLDALDESLVLRRILDRPQEHAVARRDDVPLLGAEGFQEPPRGALVEASVLAADGAGGAVDGQHAAAAARRLVHVQLHLEGGVFSAGGLRGVDRAAAGQVPFAADPLALQRRLFLKAVLVELPRPIAAAGADVAVLAKVGAEFLLFGHQMGLWNFNWPGLSIARSYRVGSSSGVGGCGIAMIFRRSSPARSSSDLPNTSDSGMSGGGGPTAPRSTGEYFATYWCLAIDSVSPGSTRLSVTRTPLTFTPLRLFKSRTCQYPQLTVNWQ